MQFVSDPVGFHVLVTAIGPSLKNGWRQVPASGLLPSERETFRTCYTIPACNSVRAFQPWAWHDQFDRCGVRAWPGLYRTSASDSRGVRYTSTRVGATAGSWSTSGR